MLNGVNLKRESPSLYSSLHNYNGFHPVKPCVPCSHAHSPKKMV